MLFQLNKNPLVTTCFSFLFRLVLFLLRRLSAVLRLLGLFSFSNSFSKFFSNSFSFSFSSMTFQNPDVFLNTEFNIGSFSETIGFRSVLLIFGLYFKNHSSYSRVPFFLYNSRIFSAFLARISSKVGCFPQQSIVNRFKSPF